MLRNISPLYLEFPTLLLLLASPPTAYFGNSSKKKFDIVGACANNCPMVPAQNILLPIAMPLSSLVVVAVSLTYFVSKKGKHVPTDQVAFMPSGIVAAMYV